MPYKVNKSLQKQKQSWNLRSPFVGIYCVYCAQSSPHNRTCLSARLSMTLATIIITCHSNFCLLAYAVCKDFTGVFAFLPHFLYFFSFRFPVLPSLPALVTVQQAGMSAAVITRRWRGCCYDRKGQENAKDWQWGPAGAWGMRAVRGRWDGNRQGP